MTQSLLEVCDLAKRYQDGHETHTIFEKLNFTLNSSSHAALVGPSGSGKSTLLNLIALLDRPTEGRIVFDGTDTGKISPAKREKLRKTEFGFVFQNHLLLPEFSLLENVMMPLLITGFSRSGAKSRANELLERLELSHRANAKPGKLSGGESQRGAICRALAKKPKLLLMDEPTGNLDPELAGKVMEGVLELAGEYGSSCLVVTHNMELANSLPEVYELVHHGLQKRQSDA